MSTITLPETHTEAAAVAALAKPEIQFVNGRPFALLPGRLPSLMEDAEELTPFVEAAVRLDSLPALREYCVSHRDESSEGYLSVFADRENLRVSAIFDFHLSAASRGRCADTAHHALRHDPRYARLLSATGQWLDQEQFIDFLEWAEPLIHQPAASSVLALARHLEIHRTSKVVAKRSLKTGASTVVFEDEDGEAAAKLPEKIVFGTPVFAGHFSAAGKRKAWLLECRLRYRVREGAVAFQLAPSGLEDLFDQVWNDVVEDVRGWGFPVFEGAPLGPSRI